MQANTCPCQAANCPGTSGFPSENYYKQGPTLAPTEPRLITNVIQNIEEAQETAPNLCQATPAVVFHPDTPSFSPRVLTRGFEWTVLPARAETAHTEPALTETAAPDPDTPSAVRSIKRNSNRARPTYDQIVSPSPPSDPGSDIIPETIFGGNDGDYYYVESAENLPTRSANTSVLEGDIS